MTQPKHRILSSKEGQLFKELLTQYELKQYKKGLKAADTILKKFPNHGETLALKALTLHSSLPFPPTLASLPKQEEAETMARTAVKKDITSHITWHVLGILAKSRKDWAEASRAFAMARKQDNDNIPLIRDAIALYLHTRQYAPAIAARHHYLLLRPQIRASWLGLMVAHHLHGDVDEALEVFDGYTDCVKTDGASDAEKAQVLLYVVRMCVEAGHERDGLSRLEMGLRNGILSSRGEATQLKAEILAKVGSATEAEDTYRALLEQNSDNLEYYRGFLRTKGYEITGKLPEDEGKKVLSALAAFAESYPRSAAPKRLSLDIAQGETFRELARSYLISGLEKGVPSLFVDVKGVYIDAEKMKMVGEIVEDLIARLERDSAVHDDDSTAPPTVLLWAYYYFALHLSHPSNPSVNPTRSLDLLDKALKHTPTLPEIYMAKAMVLKRAGDPYLAAKAMEEARLLDLQDRFLNGKAAKYWLRAGKVRKAEELLAMFTKKDITPLADLTELQCLWFLQEEGDAHRRNGNLALALKRHQSLFTVFQDYEDDQYDFHTYCMRRMTLNAYIRLMRYEDQLRANPGYFKAAISAVEIYLRLHDDPALKIEKISQFNLLRLQKQAEQKSGAEEEAERKKAAKKAQKAEQKARKAAATSSDAKKEDQPAPDEDPDGQKLLQSETPLEDALKVFAPLRRLAAGRIETWTTAYELDVRRGKLVSALKCLLQANEMDPENATLHHQVLHFRRIATTTKDLSTAVQTTIETLLPELIPQATTSESYNTAFLHRHLKSSHHILASARGLLEAKRAISTDPLPEDTATSVLQILARLVQDEVPPNVLVMTQALDLLDEVKAERSQKMEFRQRCHARVPLAFDFLDGSEQAKRKSGGGEGEAGEVNGAKEGKTDV